MRFSNGCGLALAGLLMIGGVARADGDKKGHEEMKAKHDACLKEQGFDDATIAALGECHKGAMHDHKGGKDAMKSAMEACLKGKNITLTDDQKSKMETCHHHHKGGEKSEAGDKSGGGGGW
jgi:hypothetical protein